MHRLRKLREEDGFTLIELLIVIVVLGILAAIVVFAVQGIEGNAKLTACKADVASVTTASEAYYAANGSYITGAVGDTSAINALTPTYLHSNPGDVSIASGGGTTSPQFAGTYSGGTC